MDDLISRAAALNVVEKMYKMCEGNLSDYHDLLVACFTDLTPAQPEIIRCCKCVYWQQNTVRQNSNDAGWWNEALCEKHTIYGNEPHEAWVDADWYCADAERGTDE